MMSAAGWRKSLCNTCCLNWEFTPCALGLLLLNDYPNNSFFEGLNSAEAEREQVLELLGRGDAWDVHKVEVGRIKKKKKGWQGLGYDGETSSHLYSILSCLPPIITGLNVRSRAELCGWMMGAVPLLPHPWFCWSISQTGTPTSSNCRMKEWWVGWKIYFSSNLKGRFVRYDKMRYSWLLSWHLPGSLVSFADVLLGLILTALMFGQGWTKTPNV